jgi:thymidylate kinase
MNDCSLKWLDSIHQVCARPDIVIILDLNVEIAIERLRYAGRALHKCENLHDLRRVRENYRKLSEHKLRGDGRFCRSDRTRPHMRFI